MESIIRSAFRGGPLTIAIAVLVVIAIAYTSILNMSPDAQEELLYFVKDFISPITTKPWGKFIPNLTEEEKPNQGEINSQILYSEPKGLNTNKELPKVEKSAFKKGVYY